ncbi:Rne/Rng family ribonuclease [Erythrobacter rubeus]|uniref:Ribonuclease n=1 Tax=Erythrobacter rubeus TaxID=2760803 RepID=A0ABR8KVW8_9SPHN|nr:ribonuclease [Erythrobacter rubeus]MBD2842351.1 ribonuclease [Erythrobacter rubeus]
MPEWLVERGIGETRALLVDGDQVLTAKLHWPGELRAGDLAFATLISKHAGARRGTARLEDGRDVLVDRLPPEATEGVRLSVRIARAPIAERGRLKLAQARCIVVGSAPTEEFKTTDEPRSRDIFTLGDNVRRLPPGLWEDVWSAASSGSVEFPSGEILISTTPAMTLVDIDGDGSAKELSLAAIPAIAQALSWFDLGGSIGIDFPTITDRAGRKAVDETLGRALFEWPHERTAMNGFGFVQLVARLEGPSLLHRFATSRVGMCARMALRRAEFVEGTGPIVLLAVHPALKAKLKSEWIEELARRTGKQVRIEVDPGLALEAAQAQIVAS